MTSSRKLLLTFIDNIAVGFMRQECSVFEVMGFWSWHILCCHAVWNNVCLLISILHKNTNLVANYVILLFLSVLFYYNQFPSQRNTLIGSTLSYRITIAMNLMISETDLKRTSKRIIPLEMPLDLRERL